MTYDEWKGIFTPKDKITDNYQFTYRYGSFTVGILLGSIYVDDELCELLPIKKQKDNETLIIEKTSKYDIYKGRLYNVNYVKDGETKISSLYINAELTHVDAKRKKYLKKALDFAMKR